MTKMDVNSLRNRINLELVPVFRNHEYGDWLFLLLIYTVGAHYPLVPTFLSKNSFVVHIVAYNPFKAHIKAK